MKKLLIFQLIMSLIISLKCSTIPILDLSVVTPYTIINHTNFSLFDNETIAEMESEKPSPLIPIYQNDPASNLNITVPQTTSEIKTELKKTELNETSTIISNYVEVFMFNNDSVQNTTLYPQTATKLMDRNDTILLTPSESNTNSTSDNFTAFNITVFENSFSFSSSNSSKTLPLLFSFSSLYNRVI